MPGYKSNITDHYDQKRLEKVQRVIETPPEPDFIERWLGRRRYQHIQNDESARQQTISMRDAVALSKDSKYLQRTDLSDDQKKLIEAVVEERTTESGRYLTDEAAKNDVWLVVDNKQNASGANYDDEKLMTVQFKSKNFNTDITHDTESVRDALHHELVHSEQTTSGRAKMPEGLSSYDQRIWKLGREGQAFVEQENERRLRDNKPPMTNEEKREFFSRRLSEDVYAGHYGLNNSSRTDGRRLTKEEFDNAFGTIPGEKNSDNFLKGGNHQDPADLFKSHYYDPVTKKEIPLGPRDPNGRDPFDRARYEAEQTPLKYNQLPAASQDTRRYETADKSMVVCVTKELGTDQSKVEIYRLKNLPGGPAYVKGDEKEITYAKPSYNPDGSLMGYNASYAMDFPDKEGGKHAVIFLQKDKDPRVKIYDQKNNEISLAEQKPPAATPFHMAPTPNNLVASQTPFSPIIASGNTNDWLANWEAERRSTFASLKIDFNEAVTPPVYTPLVNEPVVGDSRPEQNFTKGFDFG